MRGVKKSFILHKDSLGILGELTDEQAGQLFRAIAAYQNGEDIELNPVIKIAFAPFKHQFIRDAVKYETVREARADAGSKGGKQKVANASKSKQRVANVADSDSDSDSDSVNDSAKAERNISTISKFESSRDKLVEAAREKYPDKDCGAAFDSMLEWAKMKGATYRDWKLAYFRWVRNDRFGDFSGGGNTNPNFVNKVRDYKRRMRDSGYYVDDVGGWENEKEFAAYTFMVGFDNARGVVIGDKASVQRRLTEKPGWERLTPVSL